LQKTYNSLCPSDIITVKALAIKLTSTILTSSPIAQPSYTRSTYLNIKILKENYILLRNENDLLKSQVVKLNEELETYKNPRTCAL
ncbi:42174_t:CDS:2, partial [Gigaspora margarita]